MAEITSTYYSTSRLRIHALQKGDLSGNNTVIFIHGNASSSVFWEEIMLNLPDEIHAIAPDLRGYGKTEDKIIDATRGFSDQAEDIIALLGELNVEKIHVAGHSMGGGVIYQLMTEIPEKLASVTLINPVSPYGFGGTKNETGTPIWEDFAGTGGGVANPEFARRIKEKDTTEEDPNASPRVVMNAFYWKPPFRSENEEVLLEGVLEQKIGEKKYPGDSESSENWPFMKPGKFGPVNAASPKYLQGLAEKIIHSNPKPPVLWIRGSDDLIVSDESLFDMNTLGKMGLIPDYPGEEICPPQPMIAQTRYVLKRYEEEGGKTEEVVMKNTGHSPYIEQPEIFMKHFLNLINGRKS